MERSAASYTQGDAFAAEKAAVFARAWLPLCHVAQVAAPGDYVAQSIGGWPVFGVRGDDGAVRVFRNVCRHQSMQVVEKPAGRTEHLRCRYHGWTYDRAGRFVCAPDPVAPADPASPANHLPPLRSLEAHGFILFALADAPPPALAELHALFATVDARAYASSTIDASCNWKTWLEQRAAAAASRQGSLLWPLLVAYAGDGGVTVEQVIPRSFVRTRVIFHRIGAPSPDLAAAAAAARTEAEALQAARAAGDMDAPGALAAALHAQLAEALAGHGGVTAPAASNAANVDDAVAPATAAENPAGGA